jgi:DNA-binding transcriptional LysR family regulator
VPQVSVAIDAYFPRPHLIACLRTLQQEFPTAVINLRITSMQGGENLVLEKVCALAVTIENVPTVNPDAMERNWLCEAKMVTVCAPSHPLASTPKPIPLDEFGRHVQIVVTDNQPGAEKTQQGVAGKRQWLVNDLGAKCDLLKAGLGWGHLPWHLVGEDLAGGPLVELERRAWHVGPLSFMLSQRRGYDLSPCESRLVELLAQAQCIPKKAGQRSVSAKGAKA